MNIESVLKKINKSTENYKLSIIDIEYSHNLDVYDCDVVCSCAGRTCSCQNVCSCNYNCNCEFN